MDFKSLDMTQVAHHRQIYGAEGPVETCYEYLHPKIILEVYLPVILHFKQKKHFNFTHKSNLDFHIYTVGHGGEERTKGLSLKDPGSIQIL